MLALAAAFIFILAAFDAKVEDVRLVPLGLFALALHHAIGAYLPWPRRQPPP